jgi:hypothetical protein
MMATGAMADLSAAPAASKNADRGGRKARKGGKAKGGPVPGAGAGPLRGGRADDDTLSMCSQDDVRSIAYSMAESTIA